MSSLKAIYTDDELRELLREARLAYHVLTTRGTVQEVRTEDRLTRFHPTESRALLKWIQELESALGILKRGRSRTVYF